MAMKKIIQRTMALALGLTLSVIVWAGLETGTYISDLVSTNPLSSDLASTGDDHLRLIKSTVKTTFPNISGAVTPTHTELNFVDGVTSAVQTQLDAKAPTASPTFTGTATAAALTVTGDANLNTIDSIAIADFARLSVDNLYTQSDAGSAALRQQNTSTGAAALAFLSAVNSAQAITVLMTSTGYSGSFLAGGPSGQSGNLYTDGSVPVSIGTNLTERIRIAGDGSLINLQATAVQTNGVDITAASGSFTGTTTGHTVAQNGTFYYSKQGNTVTLSVPFLTGTSNATTFTITGLPAVIDGTREQFIPMRVADNSIVSDDNESGISVGSSTTITVRWNISASGFTASGIKAICDATVALCNVTYLLN